MKHHPTILHTRRGALQLLGAVLLAPVAVCAAEDSGAKLAFEYFRRLAEEGIADAQLVLGDLYRKGEGVPADPVEAYAWYYVAAQQGVEEAITPMNEVLRSLPQSKWPAAKQRAEEYERHFVAKAR